MPSQRWPGRVPLTSATAVVLAITMGLGAGYLDVAIIVLKKFYHNPEGYYRIAADFPWSVPLGHAVLMLIPGLLLSACCRIRPGMVSLWLGSWLLAMLALWGALLRIPFYGACSLLMAAGIGRLVADAIAADGRGARRMRYVPAAFLGLLVVLGAATTGREMLREYRAVRALPAPPRSRNVILVVWDTVRADHLSLFGFGRETSPNLVRWSPQSILYACALSPAPWTFPSHSCFLTGQWPFKLDSQWKPRLDAAYPTLAEYLSSRGYQTAGFAANTNCCTYETEFNRGFLHYEDYSTSPGSLFARTVPGEWLLEQGLTLIGDYWDAKWVILQARDAAGVNDRFLKWVDGRRTDRPFFAFLNVFDAHDSYIPPSRFLGRFGTRPRTRQDFQFLRDYVGLDKAGFTMQNLRLARDCYDDCIAYLDEQFGRLMDELERRGLLADTDVIITSDHGEGFAEHGLIGHSYSVMLEEVRVPLMIISPDAPAGRTVFQPISLRDLPATVVDRVGLADGSPIPGTSLAAHWGSPSGPDLPEHTTPAFSEQANRSARMELRPQPGPGGPFPGFQMSLVSWAHHYIRDGEGTEKLYDLRSDPLERKDISGSSDRKPILEAFREMLLRILTESPGSTAVERAYLQSYRQSLQALVRGRATGRVAGDVRIGIDPDGPSRRPDS